MSSAWLYLMLAAALEVCWTFSLKALSMQKIRDIDWSHALAQPAGLLPLVPLLAYVAFGLGNVVFLSAAMRTIPTATAYASWMALAVVGIKIADVLVFKQPFSWLHVLFTGLIIVGVLGLRRLP